MRKRSFSSLQHVWSITQDGCCSLLCPDHQSLLSLPLIKRKKVPILQPGDFIHDVVFVFKEVLQFTVGLSLLDKPFWISRAQHRANSFPLDWLVNQSTEYQNDPAAFNCPFNWVFEFLTTEHILISNCQKREMRMGNAGRGMRIKSSSFIRSWRFGAWLPPLKWNGKWSLGRMSKVKVWFVVSCASGKGHAEEVSPSVKP